MIVNSLNMHETEEEEYRKDLLLNYVFFCFEIVYNEKRIIV